MSEFVVCDVVYSDVEILKKSLIELGVPDAAIEVHDTPVALKGYHGTKEGKVGHVVIRAGRCSNSYDIGFEKTAEGYSPRVCDMDRRNIGGKVMNDLKQTYAKVTVVETIRRKHGCRITSNEKDKDGKVRIKVRF